MRLILLVTLVTGLVGCGQSLVTVVVGGPDTGTVEPVTDPTFEIIARAKGVRDPLPVKGANVAYADLERSLSQAIVHSVHPRHESTLMVEIVSAEATYDKGDYEPNGSGSYPMQVGRVSISFVARATLKKHEGNAFVGQTQLVCRDAELVEPAAGSRVVWNCMVQLGRDLGGWLDGIAPQKG